MPLTPDQKIFAGYCRGLTKLSVWYARKRILEGTSDVRDAFNERVNIFRNTSLSRGGVHPTKGDVIPEWDTILDKVEEVFERRLGEEDTALLEQESLDLFWPVLEARIKTFKRGRTEPRPYEAWTFDYWDEGGAVNIHIHNIYVPESPLSEKLTEFAASLIRLLEDSQANRPEIEVVSCGSWMNSAPRFQELFTEAWRESSEGSRTVRYMLGHWGQFTDRRGDFHDLNGARFRETGQFPYPCTRCEDRIDATLDHLRSTFPEAVEHNSQHHGR